MSGERSPLKKVASVLLYFVPGFSPHSLELKTGSWRFQSGPLILQARKQRRSGWSMVTLLAHGRGGPRVLLTPSPVAFLCLKPWPWPVLPLLALRPCRVHKITRQTTQREPRWLRAEALEGAGWGRRWCGSDQLLAGRGKALRLGLEKARWSWARRPGRQPGAARSLERRRGARPPGGRHFAPRGALVPLKGLWSAWFVCLPISVGKDVYVWFAISTVLNCAIQWH